MLNFPFNIKCAFGVKISVWTDCISNFPKGTKHFSAQAGGSHLSWIQKQFQLNYSFPHICEASCNMYFLPLKHASSHTKMAPNPPLHNFLAETVTRRGLQNGKDKEIGSKISGTSLKWQPTDRTNPGNASFFAYSILFIQLQTKLKRYSLHFGYLIRHEFHFASLIKICRTFLHSKW